MLSMGLDAKNIFEVDGVVMRRVAHVFPLSAGFLTAAYGAATSSPTAANTIVSSVDHAICFVIKCSGRHGWGVRVVLPPL